MTRKKSRWSAVAALLMISALVAAVAFRPYAAHATSVTNVQVNQVLAGPFPKNKQNEPYEPDRRLERRDW